MRRPYLLIALAAFLIVVPLLAGGCSCGHDFDFHIQSWLEAAAQFRHGILNPHWAYSAAYNAGEPRFVFYPPLSWTLGALLTFFVPAHFVTTAFTFLALTAAGLTMHRLASYFSTPNTALLATVLYLANPYMLFTAFERTAYAELLAAAWLPLLFLAVLRARPTVRGIALPVALLWLTNAPAAVMGCYAMALILTLRLATTALSRTSSTNGGAPLMARPHRDMGGSTTEQKPSALSLLSTAITGTTLGLTLAGFYLIPAAYERRFVQINMAIIPNMRVADNFLFGHTPDAPHNAVLHTASIVAVELLAATTAAVALLYARRQGLARSVPEPAPNTPQVDYAALALPTLAVALLLTPLSTPLWNHVPELAFLQFPWRLLLVLAVVLALAVTMLLRRAALGLRSTIVLAAVIVSALTAPAIHAFRQPCEDDGRPETRAALFAAHRGVEPTDEYTPTEADNDILRADDPPFWLAADPAAFAPGSTPNPAGLPGASDVPDASVADAEAELPHTGAPATPDLSIHAPSAGFLVLNRRDYPAWVVTLAAAGSTSLQTPRHIPRDDGLIALPLPAGGDYTVHIRWQRTPDERLGIVTSLVALLLYLALALRGRSRRIEP